MIDQTNCCGCGACSNICPKEAIKMNLDGNGFIFPEIDQEKCIQCKLCEKTCPRLSLLKCNVAGQTYYAAYSKDLEVRKHSSSGGLFSAISDYIIDNGGYVVGVKENEDLSLSMEIVSTKEERNRFRKSKYVQCLTGNIYSAVKEKLDEGKLVLFTGLPCQVAALRLFLRKDYKNLICVDILCHGIPSEALFKDYIEWKEKKANKKIVKYNFRDRHNELGWKKTVFSAEYSDGSKEIIDSRYDYFFGLFYRDIGHRDSCFKCVHRNINRPGDITLGDFWNVEKFFPDIDTFNGVSLLIVNNDKGKDLIKRISSTIELKQCDLSRDLPVTMLENNPPNKYRDKFFALRKKRGFSFACFIYVFLFRVAMKLHLVPKNYK